MSYFVEAYLNTKEYEDGRRAIILIFSDKDEFKRLQREYFFFSTIFIVSKGEVDRLNCITEDSDNDSSSSELDCIKEDNYTDSSNGVDLDSNGEIQYW